MQRVTLDTNVYISALISNGPGAQLLRLAREGTFALQLSEAISDEIAEVLERNFDWSRERTDQLREVLAVISHRVLPRVELEVVERDPDDNRILECSQASKSDYIVTNDKDLLSLKIYAGARILRPTEYLALISTVGERGFINEPET